MPLRRWTIVVILAALVAGGGTWWNVRRLAAAEVVSARAAANAARAEREVREADLTFFLARLAEDSSSSLDHARLAALYLQRARDGGDAEDYLQAERSARTSIALRRWQNGDASAALTSALLSQHRFSEARDAARQLATDEPLVDAYRALLGETCLELGDYDCARVVFDAIAPRARRSLPVAPRLARWAEIRGDTVAARKILSDALAAAQLEPDMPREQIAWFHLRLADLLLRQGRDRGAERTLRDGLTVHPGDPRLLAAMTRLAAAHHDWHAAIQFGDSAIAIMLDPSTLGVVSDAYAALGDSAKAAEYDAAMEVAVGRQIGTYHRAWSLYLLDHGRRIPDVLAAAQAELDGGRRDVQGYDLLAWALYKSGRARDARTPMAAALAQGTQDALLFYHAGMIARAAGDPTAARDYLQRALAIAPSFDYAAPAIARAALDSLRRTD
jgi:tetratricopeptide (TPR) repeat protein